MFFGNGKGAALAGRAFFVWSVEAGGYRLGSLSFSERTARSITVNR